MGAPAPESTIRSQAQQVSFLLERHQGKSPVEGVENRENRGLVQILLQRAGAEETLGAPPLDQFDGRQHDPVAGRGDVAHLGKAQGHRIRQQLPDRLDRGPARQDQVVSGVA